MSPFSRVSAGFVSSLHCIICLSSFSDLSYTVWLKRVGFDVRIYSNQNAYITCKSYV